jgi:hypothetical protein
MVLNAHFSALLISLWVILSVVNGFSARPASTSPVKVVVTGASSSVGLLVFKKLLKSKKFTPVGLVRDNRGAQILKKLGATDEQIFKGDITDKKSIGGLFEGADKAVLCTSARPRKTFWFRLISFLAKIFGRDLTPSGRDLYYKKKETPYHVDFVGQKNVIDACMAAKVDHVVMLGNMGGYRGSRLNSIGRSDGEDPKKGNLLKWKRAAERYLIKRCYYTIIHSASLTDDKGGRREIVWDTDDALLRTPFRKIPKEDVAEVLVQALVWKEAIGKLLSHSLRSLFYGRY